MSVPRGGGGGGAPAHGRFPGLVAQPWSTDRIGQQGSSYGGLTSYRAAALQPPHLVAIAPACPGQPLRGQSVPGRDLGDIQHGTDRPAAGCDPAKEQPPGTLLARWDRWLDGDHSAPLPDARFTSAALSEDTVLAGSVRLRLNTALSAPDANFYVQLDDIAPDGTATQVNDGFLLASHRVSDSAPQPVRVGTPTGHTVKVWPQHWRFAEGHRLRLTVSGGDPTMLKAPDPVQVTVNTVNSYADFPFRTAR
ncbi:CocE/NonD family hydrolase C-terminal non-catalytic domain-containing protein [Streptomyces sp. NPDC057137]|uniref:CocE/NonD family hydrolase C-terminal non-catalytic domain-containing protein n=1 Tax=Streptomyces sp. NPDC057137 TaxID=3346030 RepID=UPI00362B4747